MKKVLVLAVMFVMVATTASLAAIQGTKHDLGTASAFGTDEICVFCHTPHGAQVSQIDYMPLWNRTLTTTGLSSWYTSATMDSTASDGGKMTAIDALLCLSCHDGATNILALINPPNDNTTSTTTYAGPSWVLSGAVALDTNFGDDHPVAIQYDPAFDDELNPIAGLDAAIDLKDLTTDTTNFGAGFDAVVVCASCHDVHGGVASTPFLVMSNSQSGLCLECHNK